MEIPTKTPSHDTCYILKPNHHMDNLQRKYPQTGLRSLELFPNSKIINNQNRVERLGGKNRKNKSKYMSDSSK